MRGGDGSRGGWAGRIVTIDIVAEEEEGGDVDIRGDTELANNDDTSLGSSSSKGIESSSKNANILELEDVLVV